MSKAWRSTVCSVCRSVPRAPPQQFLDPHKIPTPDFFLVFWCEVLSELGWVLPNDCAVIHESIWGHCCRMNLQPSAVWLKRTRDIKEQFFSVCPVSLAELYLFQRWQDDEVQGGQSLTSHPLLSEEHRSPLSRDRNQRRLQILNLSTDSMKRCEAVCQEVFCCLSLMLTPPSPVCTERLYEK